jgi:hypothetical protein
MTNIRWPYIDVIFLKPRRARRSPSFVLFVLFVVKKIDGSEGLK